MLSQAERQRGLVSIEATTLYSLGGAAVLDSTKSLWSHRSLIWLFWLLVVSRTGRILRVCRCSPPSAMGNAVTGFVTWSYHPSHVGSEINKCNKENLPSSLPVEERSSSNSTLLQDEVILASWVLGIWDSKLKFLSHPKAKLSLCYGFIFTLNCALGLAGHRSCSHVRQVSWMRCWGRARGEVQALSVQFPCSAHTTLNNKS